MRLSADPLATVAHELRRPLQILSLSTEALLFRARASEPVPVHELREELERQQRAVRRLQHLLESLLATCQVNAGGFELLREPVELSGLVRSIQEQEREAFARAGCVCTIDAPAPVLGYWDRFRLEIAISNLITNAVKYGAGHPVEISVGGTAALAWVRVIDHGIGIAPADQARVFDRYFRIASHTEGFGLGLWLVRLIAAAHGGEVQLSSTPGQGSSFTLTLPRLDGLKLEGQCSVASWPAWNKLGP